jgi:hypothetical protein
LKVEVREKEKKKAVKGKSTKSEANEWQNLGI